MNFEQVVYDMLDLPDIKINHIEINKQEIHIYIETSKDTICSKCGSHNVEVKDIVIREYIRDRSIMRKKCFLHVTVRVLKCKDCKGQKREKFDFFDSYSRQTKRYKKYVSQLGFELDVQSIMTMEELGRSSVEKIITDYAFKHQPTSLNGAKRLGIDEFSRRKGHKSYQPVIADLDKSKPLAVLSDRNEKELRSYFESIPKQERETVMEFSMDMWSQYVHLTKQYFPNARITIDRFHVMQHVNKMVDKIRVKESKTLTKDQKQQVKNIHWIIRKNSRKLSLEDKDKLKIFFRWCKKTKKAYKRKEEFVKIMDKNTDVRKGKQKLEKWITQLEKLKTKKATSFAKTVTKFIDYIANYFAYNTTNATLEGIMTKIKVVKRKAYGIPNPYHMKTRIFLAFQQRKSLYSTV